MKNFSFEAERRKTRVNGCVLIKCPYYKDGKCTNQLDFVNKFTGEDMCPYNADAIPREEYEEYEDE